MFRIAVNIIIISVGRQTVQSRILPSNKQKKFKPVRSISDSQ